MEQELELIELWQIFSKRWKMIILVTLLAALICAAVSLFLIKPQYVASSTLMVMKPVEAEQILYQDIQVSRQLADTYQVVVHSRRVLDKVTRSLNLPYTHEQMQEKVKVSSVQDTEIITIDVTDTDPYLAARMSNLIAQTFMQEVTEIMNIDNVSPIDEAAVPDNPVSPRVGLNIAVAMVLGFMVAVGLALLQHYLDQTLKTTEEVENLLGLTVLGTIPMMEDN
ncbi:MAG TPA: Wzz/FepE/Etk N-terminal domain-containing protein [Bacillota bacterium]|nr:Wzz/FepE/Etk N-terminal domain-containing protein [Bacillota bacterium]